MMRKMTANFFSRYEKSLQDKWNIVMPWVVWKCRQCAHEFKRLLLIGEKPSFGKCPKCGATDSDAMVSGQPLFEGISSFSSLDGDTN
jgi:rubrerythrin